MKLFEVRDVLGNKIMLTRERWNHAWRHRDAGIENIRGCVRDPDEIRESREDSEVRLYYQRREGGYLCVVVHSKGGFIMTAYETSDMKEGDVVWTKS